MCCPLTIARSVCAKQSQDTEPSTFLRKMAQQFKARIHCSIHCQELNRWKDWEAKCNKDFKRICPAGKSDDLPCRAVVSFFWLSWNNVALWLALSYLRYFACSVLDFFFFPILVFVLGFAWFCPCFTTKYSFFLSDTESKWNNMEIYLKFKQELRISK